MEAIEITIQVDPGTEEITVIPNSRNRSPNMAVHINWQGKPEFVDIDKALDIMDSYAGNCASDMIGDSDYILVYDTSKTVKADGHTYVGGEALIMKSNYGLKPMDRIEIMAAMTSFRGRLVPLNFGPFGILAYEVS